MTDAQLVSIVAAVLFKIRDTNPPHGAFEPPQRALDRAIRNARQLVYAVERVQIDIVFDGPPGHDAPRFIEVESPPGSSIKFGTWMQRPDGYWVLRFNVEKCDGNHALPRCSDPECWHD